MKNEMVDLINEDGTLCDYNFPKNPLKEKWERLYPATPKPEYSQVCDGYSCMWCGRCPNGSYWKVPEEDLEVWNEYKKAIKEYNKIHNPEMYNELQEEKIKVLKNKRRL